MKKRRGSRVLIPGEAQARGGLILPGAAPKGAATLFVPKGHETTAPVLVGRCHVCDAVFYRGEEEEWQRHVGRCAREHLPELLAAREEQKRAGAIFQEESWDPEVARHMEKVGQRMKREGRWTVKPSERAGF